MPKLGWVAKAEIHVNFLIFFPAVITGLFSVPGSSAYFSENLHPFYSWICKRRFIHQTWCILHSADCIKCTSLTVDVFVYLNWIYGLTLSFSFICVDNPTTFDRCRLQSTHLKSMSWRRSSKRDPASSGWSRENWRQSRSFGKRKPKWSKSSIVWEQQDWLENLLTTYFLPMWCNVINDHHPFLLD